MAVCAAALIALAMPTRGHAAQFQERTLYTFCRHVVSDVCSDAASQVDYISDASGNLYGTTLGGGKPLRGNSGVAFQLTPNASRTAWQQTVLYSFCSEPACADGFRTNPGLIMDAAGNLYGTAEEGGAGDAGVVFRLTPDATRTKWTETVLFSFCSQINCATGAFPRAGLIIDKAGNLYGTASQTPTLSGNGGGVVFELSPNADHAGWTQKVLYTFCALSQCADGREPAGALMLDAVGNLYGTTLAGGEENAWGVVFELTPNATRAAWAESVLYRFCSQPGCGDGRLPRAGLIMDRAGNLYGTTEKGGTSTEKAGAGVVFELIPNEARAAWSETVLYRFCSKPGCTDGQGPLGGSLIADGEGNLYGTTAGGGASSSFPAGVVFELSLNPSRTAWSEKVLYSFCSQGGDFCTDGVDPYGVLMMDKAGDLYGTTADSFDPNNAGTIFELVKSP